MTHACALLCLLLAVLWFRERCRVWRLTDSLNMADGETCYWRLEAKADAKHACRWYAKASGRAATAHRLLDEMRELRASSEIDAPWTDADGVTWRLEGARWIGTKPEGKQE